jgi:HEAT repeat protein
VLRLLILLSFIVTRAAPASASDLFSDLDLVKQGLKASEPGLRRAAIERLDAFGEEARPLLYAALSDSDPQVRARAASSVGHHHFAEGISRLWPLLEDAETNVRAAAVIALGELETAGSATLARTSEALERAAQDHAPEVRGEAVTVLARLPARPRSFVPALVARLEDESAEVRRRAARGLGNAGAEAVVPLIGRLADTSNDVRLAVLDALGQVGDPRAASGVLRLVSDPNDEVRAEAVSVLGRLKAPLAERPLAELLLRGAEPLCGRAAFALAPLAALPTAEGHAALSALILALGRDDARRAAAEALRAVGSVAIPALVARFPLATEAERGPLLALLGSLGDGRAAPILVEELLTERSPKDTVLDALLAIALADRHGGHGEEIALTALASFSNHKDTGLRRRAVKGLAQVGDPRVRALLVEALSDTDQEVRLAAIEGLGRTGGAKGRSGLITALRSSDAETARAAARALAEAPLVTASDPALPAALLVALERPEPLVRRAAGDALSRLDDPATRAPLLQLIHAGSAGLRVDALNALSGAVRGRPDAVTRELCLGLAEGKEPGPALDAVGVLAAMRDVAAVPRLVRLLGQKHVSAALRRAVVAALGATPEGPTTDAALLDRLTRDPDPSVRGEAAWSIGLHRTKSAVPALEAALKSPSAALRTNAAAALARIGRAGSLVGLLDDRDEAVRANAALGLFGTRATRPRLEQLTHESGLARRAAMRALGGQGPGSGSDWLLVRIVDFDGAPLPEAAYLLSLPDGLIKSGRADERGIAREEQLPSGTCDLEIADRS